MNYNALAFAVTVAVFFAYLYLVDGSPSRRAIWVWVVLLLIATVQWFLPSHMGLLHGAAPAPKPKNGQAYRVVSSTQDQAPDCWRVVFQPWPKTGQNVLYRSRLCGSTPPKELFHYDQGRMVAFINESRKK